MTYSCTDFTDDILDALKIDVPDGDSDNPSAQADLAMAEIERLQAADKELASIKARANTDGEADTNRLSPDLEPGSETFPDPPDPSKRV